VYEEYYNLYLKIKMNIKKIGHCCLLIETDVLGTQMQENQGSNIKPLTILTDPGIFTTAQNELAGIDIVLITHEHGDHMHVESLEQILRHNPTALVITNSGVSKILTDKGIMHEVLDGTAEKFVGQMRVQACDGKHAEIFEEIGQVQNTGYMFGKADLDTQCTFFIPGDAFIIPKTANGEQVSVDVLALPISGPWCRIPDALHYALAVAPKFAIPVHDGQLSVERMGANHKIPEMVLNSRGVQFVSMVDGDIKDF
jgi:L-ascorbate metabolism protein UlaG (beta-lactamase superfamily)